MGHAKARELLRNKIESPVASKQMKEIDKIVEEATTKSREQKILQ